MSIVHSHLQDKLLVNTIHNHSYAFDLRKLQHKTRIHGDDYNKFLKDYDMEPSDMIILAFVDVPFAIYPRSSNGLPKERVVQDSVEGM